MVVSSGHDTESSVQARYEEELNRIRTEGDLVLIKTQAARQSIKEVDDELRRLRQQLKDRKKQISSPIPAAVVHTMTSEHGNSMNSMEAASLREIQVEERLRVAVSERAVELQKLRQAIDSARRQRLDALANEQRIVNETQHLEETIQQSQQEVDALKAKATATKDEIARVQQEFEIDQHTLRVENQRLALEVERIAKPDKSTAVGRHMPERSRQGTHVLCIDPLRVKYEKKRSTVKNLITRRRKYDSVSNAQMEQKVVSFEQKKMLLEKILNVSGVQDLDDFIRLYNTQEQEKAEILARIEAQSSLNSSLTDSVNQLEEEITRLSGTGDLQIILRTEHAPELKKIIDSDEAQTQQWSMKAQVFSEILKTLRDPIRELYRELVPQDRENESGYDTIVSSLDRITLDDNMLRRIGVIEERTMQRILLKILTELENSPHSETLGRFRHYQGIQQSLAQTHATPDSVDAPISLLDAPLPSVDDQLSVVDGNEEEEEISTNLQQLSVVHCSPTRYKKTTNTSSSASSTCSTSASSSTIAPMSVSASACHGPSHRKTTVAVIPT